MSKYDPKYVRHMHICEDLNKMYIFKNERYNNSFGAQFEELGPVSAVVRLSDKFNRLKALLLNPVEDVGDESVLDTLSDMANYCIMTMIELEVADELKLIDDVSVTPEDWKEYDNPDIVGSAPVKYTTKQTPQDPNSPMQCCYCMYDTPDREALCNRCYDFDQFHRVE